MATTTRVEPEVLTIAEVAPLIHAAEMRPTPIADLAVRQRNPHELEPEAITFLLHHEAVLTTDDLAADLRELIRHRLALDLVTTIAQVEAEAIAHRVVVQGLALVVALLVEAVAVVSHLVAAVVATHQVAAAVAATRQGVAVVVVHDLPLALVVHASNNLASF